MNQLKFVEDSLWKIWADHISSDFLKVLFHKFYLTWSIFEYFVSSIILTYCIILFFKESFHNNEKSFKFEVDVFNKKLTLEQRVEHIEVTITMKSLSRNLSDINSFYNSSTEVTVKICYYQ